MDLLDFSLSVVVILFILSVITEKFTQLIKEYPLVFNLLLFGIGILCFIRLVIISGILFKSNDSNNSLFLVLFASSFLINIILFITLIVRSIPSYSYGKCKNTTSVILLVFIIVSFLSLILDKFLAYLIVAEVLIYFSLVSLQQIPALNFSFRGRIFDTRLFKRINKKKFLGEKDKRAEEITALSFLVGFIVAYLFKGDFFTIIRALGQGSSDSATQPPPPSLGWDVFPLSTRGGIFVYESFTFNSKFFFGLILTGFFLSFGSKFFHDLLELLFLTKNLRGKLNDSRMLKVDNVEQFDEFLRTPESKLALAAIEKYEDDLRKIPGVLSIGPGYMWQDNVKVGCIEIHALAATALNQIRKEYSVTLNSGFAINIPTNTIITGHTTIHSARIGPGALIANENNTLGWGTLSCIVQMKGNSTDKFFLSCQHVLNNNVDLNSSALGSKLKIQKGNSEKEIGEYVFGFLTETFDIAIGKITTTHFDFDNSSIGSPKTIRKIGPNDAIRETRVLVHGGKSGVVNGVIFNNSWDEEFQYLDGKRILSDLIVLTRFDANNNFNKITQKGDSGAIVVDSENNAIGIVVGGNAAFTYAMKLARIEKFFELQLI